MDKSGDINEDTPQGDTLALNSEGEKGYNGDNEDTSIIIEDTPDNRFKEYVVQGCRIFVRTSQLLIAQATSEEAVPVKDSALQKVAGTILSTTLGEFIPFAGAITKAVINSSKFVHGKVKKKRGHDAAKRVYEVIGVVKQENWLKVMVPVLADIFLAYNVHFIHVLDKEKLTNSDTHWMRAMYKLASDTVFKIFHGLREASINDTNQAETALRFVKRDIIKAFLLGRSEGGWMRKKKIKILGGTLGHTLLKEKSGTRVTTQIFFEHPKVKCNDSIHGSAETKTPSLPWRHGFEDEELPEEKHDCTEPMTWEGREVNDMYQFLSSRREALMKEVVKELEKEGYYTFTSHDLAASHDHLIAKITELQTIITQGRGGNTFLVMLGTYHLTAFLTFRLITGI